MQSEKKLLFLLIFISSALYIFRLLKITATTGNPPIRLPTIPCTSKSPPFAPQKFSHHTSFHKETPLTPKELYLLSNVIEKYKKQNFNILFFGLNPQFLPLVKTIAGGAAIFLEDDPESIQRFSPKSSGRIAVRMVKYNERANRAYELLKHGRQNADCRRIIGGDAGSGSTCRLAIAGLPPEVYEKTWDVVVVDGPRGDGPDAPGRMSAIYTAAIIARKGNVTDVFVHDVDRMTEKWYSWDFLCHENLVSAKGKLWHFRVHGGFQSDRFCITETVQVL